MDTAERVDSGPSLLKVVSYSRKKNSKIGTWQAKREPKPTPKIGQLRRWFPHVVVTLVCCKWSYHRTVSHARRRMASNSSKPECSEPQLPTATATTRKKPIIIIPTRQPTTALEMTYHNRPGIQDPQHPLSNSPSQSSFSSGYFSVLHKVHTPPPRLPSAHTSEAAPRLRTDIYVTSAKLRLCR